MEDLFVKLPESDRKKVFDELYEAIKWRGWDRESNCHAAEAVRSIADIFEKNRIEFLEYS